MGICEAWLAVQLNWDDGRWVTTWTVTKRQTVGKSANFVLTLAFDVNPADYAIL